MTRFGLVWRLSTLTTMSQPEVVVRATVPVKKSSTIATIWNAMVNRSNRAPGFVATRICEYTPYHDPSRLFMTSQGYIGRGPLATLPGDFDPGYICNARHPVDEDFLSFSGKAVISHRFYEQW